MRKKIKTQPTSRRFVIGVDVGGTKIRGVLMRGEQVLKKAEVFYQTNQVTKKLFLRSLFFVLEKLFDSSVEKIGIGLPGVMTNDQVTGAGNLKILTHLDLKRLLEQRYRVPVVLDNDVKATLRAELPVYLSRGYQSIFLLTLGTGVGSAWWFQGRIMRGSFSTAYELGQWVFDAKTQERLEKNFSGRGFFLSRGEEPLNAEAKARQGEQRYKKLWQSFGVNLGIVLANIVNLIEPEVIIIGGGINHAWSLFISATRQTMRRLVLSRPARQQVKIVKLKNLRWAGAIGAGYLAQE